VRAAQWESNPRPGWFIWYPAPKGCDPYLRIATLLMRRPHLSLPRHNSTTGATGRIRLLGELEMLPAAVPLEQLARADGALPVTHLAGDMLLMSRHRLVRELVLNLVRHGQVLRQESLQCQL
jgi:hypothetical protein